MQECSTSVEASDGRSVFAATASGQIKMPRLGNYCLTMSGDGAAKVDIAPSADVSATSSSAQHTASSIVDGSSESHWASGFDTSSPVDVSLYRALHPGAACWFTTGRRAQGERQ